MARYNYMANTSNTGYSIFNHRVSKPGEKIQNKFFCIVLWTFLYLVFQDYQLTKKTVSNSSCTAAQFETLFCQLRIMEKQKSRMTIYKVIYFILYSLSKTILDRSKAMDMYETPCTHTTKYISVFIFH